MIQKVIMAVNADSNGGYNRMRIIVDYMCSSYIYDPTYVVRCKDLNIMCNKAIWKLL